MLRERRRPKAASGGVLNSSTPSGMLDSARNSCHATFSCAMGLPVAMSRIDNQDDPDYRKLRMGTYKVFKSQVNGPHQTKSDLPAKVRAVLNSSKKERLKNPDFIRAFVSTVLLVKPGSREHHLDLTYVGSGWYRLNSCSTLSAVRKVAGWALSSPSTVFHALGSSLNELASVYSDQILWLLSNWSLFWNIQKGKRVNLQTVFEDFSEQSEARLNLGLFMKSYMNPQFCVGHRRSSVDQTFQVWNIRCHSGWPRPPLV